jgi:carboxyl-terminal processing protease
MKTCSALIFLLLTLFVSSAGAQNKQQSISQLPDIEPFSISRGKSFAASPAKPKSFAVEKQIGADQITEDFADALEIIRNNHVGGKRIDYNELAKQSLDEMLRSLDPHSNYFDQAEYEELLTDQQSEYFGIGATIVNYEKQRQTETYVISTFPDSTADRAHLRFGDKILKVDGEAVSGLDSAVVRDKVRGKIGSIVRLTIERADTKRIETIEIKRSRVPQPSLPDAYMLRANVGYVDLSEGFNYTTAEELSAALKELHAQGMKSLILDLRGNRGGILDQAVKVAEKFLPAGSQIVSQRGRFRIDNRTWSSANKTAETMPLVVLVDESSASASEIVAGALQDYDRAIIVGEKTFGKGLVQSVINLPYGSGLTLTTARYFTPSGRSIQRDYEHAGLYEYFNHKTSLTEQEKNKTAARTVTGRKVFGGDGILPDETVKSAKLTATEISLLDPIFFFAAEVASGRIATFENYKVTTKTNRYGQRIKPSDFPVTDELLSAFKSFIAQNSNWKSHLHKFENESRFIKTRLRYNLITAAFGSVSANQVLTEQDAQVAKAIEFLPRAEQLNLAASRTKRHK